MDSGSLSDSAEQLHREMQAHARARARLDHDELETIRRCLENRLWRSVGCGSMNEYLRRYSNYTGFEARERIKAARALADVPEIRDSLQSGAIGWNHVRVVAPIVDPETQVLWRTAAESRPAAEFKEFAAGARRSDRPDDERHQELKPRPITLDLLPDQFGALDEATALMRRRDTDLTREEVVAHGCRLIIAEQSGAAGGEPAGADSGRPTYQISYSICPHCRKGSRLTQGGVIPVRPETIEKALCDSTNVGSVDGESPERASSSTAPSVVRFVRLRDRGKCRVPGCTARLRPEVHHVRWRSEGGTNEPKDLALLCDTHHDMVHDGILRIDGDANHELSFRRVDGRAYSDRQVVPRDVVLGQRAFVELCRLGHSSERVHRALQAAWQAIAGSENCDDDERLRMLLDAAHRRLQEATEHSLSG